MIYRVIGEGWSGRSMGACNGGLAFDAWDDMPAPGVGNPRARYWFTEAGWDRYGRNVAAEARASGRTFRVLRRKNPPRSAVLYRDKWQVIVLPIANCRPQYRQGA